MSRGAVPLRLSLARQPRQYSSGRNNVGPSPDDEEEDKVDGSQFGDERSATRSRRSEADSGCGGAFVLLSVGSTEEAVFLRPYFDALTALECGVLLYLSVDHPHSDFSTALDEVPRRSPFTASSAGGENDRRRRRRRRRTTVNEVDDDDDDGGK